VDDRGRKEMGDKLVMHCRRPKETAIRYNRYVVNGKLFRTRAHDAGKRTQNSGVCVPTVDGEMYYGKLTEIIEVEYYDRTKYVLFKCDWADTTRDIGYKVNEYGLVFVNFKKLVHTGKLISDEPYVLTTQVDQVFYIEDERDPGWACAVRTKPRNVYDVGGEGHDDACANYHECEPLLLTSNNDHNLQDDFDHIRPDVDPIPVYVLKKNLFEI
jgi:hypothetical protein